MGTKCLHVDKSPSETLEQLAALHARNTGDADCTRIIEGKLEKLKLFNCALLDGVYGLPQQVVHGDFYVGNVVFTGGATIARLIDFDQSCVFYRCYEVLRGLMTSILHVPESLRLECLRAYLSAYCRVMGLTWLEIMTMLPLYYFVLLGNAFGLECSERRERDYANLREFAAYRWELARWIDARFGAVQEVISSDGGAMRPERMIPRANVLLQAVASACTAMERTRENFTISVEHVSLTLRVDDEATLTFIRDYFDGFSGPAEIRVSPLAASIFVSTDGSLVRSIEAYLPSDRDEQVSRWFATGDGVDILPQRASNPLRSRFIVVVMRRQHKVLMLPPWHR